MTRGALIFPFLVEIAQLDTAATEADPDGPGPETSGYDPVFNEVVKLPSAVEGGASARREKPVVTLPCQWEVVNFQQQVQLPSGNASDTVTRVVLHFEDLEAAGLVAADGSSLVNVNDRVVRVLRCPWGELVRDFSREDERLYITRAEECSFGLTGLHRNLLVCTLEEREQGLRSPPVG